LVKGAVFSFLLVAVCAELFLKRKLSFPVSHDVAMMGEAIEHRGGHLGIAEDVRLFAEAEVGDHDAGALVERAQQMEQQRPRLMR